MSEGWEVTRMVLREAGGGRMIVTVVLRGVKIQNRLNLQAECLSLQCGLLRV